ncbi:hypothetical protein [Blastococcus sp. SYSU DS0973]
MDVMALARADRGDLRELLADLSPEQWRAPSLCAGWCQGSARALFAPTLLGALRVRGVRLVATDIDWTFGRGPEVRGAAEVILMTAAGRRGVVAELPGPGQARLARRLDG